MYDFWQWLRPMFWPATIWKLHFSDRNDSDKISNRYL
jgi:hypothetical protein